MGYLILMITSIFAPLLNLINLQSYLCSKQIFMSHTKVLNHTEVVARINRIAWQIFEAHQNNASILVAGIEAKGYKLASLICDKLKEISDLNIDLRQLRLDKKDPLASNIYLEPELKDINGKHIVIIDDVLNSGSTMIYGVKRFLDFPVASITTAVLVDRNHKRFPIKADVKGLSLSTSLQEHVEVYFDDDDFCVEVS